MFFQPYSTQRIELNHHSLAAKSRSQKSPIPRVWPIESLSIWGSIDCWKLGILGRINPLAESHPFHTFNSVWFVFFYFFVSCCSFNWIWGISIQFWFAFNLVLCFEVRSDSSRAFIRVSRDLATWSWSARNSLSLGLWISRSEIKIPKPTKNQIENRN